MGLRRLRLLPPTLAALLVAAWAGVPGLQSAEASPGAHASSTTTTTLPPNGAVELLNGGTATVGVPALPTAFNPSTPSGDNSVTQMVMEQVWPQPFVVNGSLQPVASTPTTAPTLLVSAEDVSVSPQTVVYTIDPGARWSDGVPITAADFIYDWHEQLAVGPQLGANDPLQGYQDIKSITGSAKGKVVTVVFTKPYADWYALFANLVPAHVAQRYGWEKAFQGFDPTKVVSGGPFEITKVVPGKELVLSRNPHYWGQPAHLAHIVFRVVHGQAATLQALENRSVDIASVTPGPAVTQAVAASGDLVPSTGDSPTLWQLVFNLGDPVTGRALLRQAIAKAVDRVQLAADSIDLLAQNTPISSNRLYLEAAPGSEGNDGGYATVDVAEADRLLAQDGYQLDADGRVVAADGLPLVIKLVGPSANPLMARVEELLQAQLLQAGITLQITNVPQSTLLSSVLPRGNYQLALAPYLESPYPSENAARYTNPGFPASLAPSGATAGGAPGSARLTTGGGGSPSDPGAAQAGSVSRDVLGFQDPTVTSLFAQASSDLNASAMSGLYNEIDTKLWVAMPTLPLFQIPSTLVIRVDIVNVSNTPTWAGPMWDAQDWAIQVSPPPTVPTTAP
ncbi:MAG TPA: ABC transporter family substrate-binding protein [Acidimicrobiales bacterium]|nr:ABC transporter family substrate-binding protein [Acidimicrobiales bacterium]